VKKLTWFGWIVLAALPAHAADHLDSPSAVAEPLADITDVYAFMTEDAARLNVIMNVSPFSASGAAFSTAVTYVVHVNSSAAYGEEQTETQILCQFYDTDSIECWAKDSYVTGDPSDTAGIESSDGKVRVFAGLRDDPFFFELNGFKEVAKTVAEAAPDLTFDSDGCPELDEATSDALIAQLQAEPPTSQGGAGGGTGIGGVGGAALPPAEDNFAGANILALVIQIDKTVVNSGGDVLGIWGSTHAAN
jgi:hypothetical protein